MSMKTWREEFYPVSAATARRRSWRWAAKHSLRKWEGLKEENLRKHDVRYSPEDNAVVGANGARLRLDGETCALCYKAQEAEEADLSMNGCDLCPLALVGYNCSSCESAYHRARSYDPAKRSSGLRDLIRGLKKAVRFTETHKFCTKRSEWVAKG